MRFLVLPLLALMITSCASHRSGRDFYVSTSGNDNDNGSFRNPWKTVTPVNNTVFRPGDKVFFEGGKVFTGTILIDSLDNGSAGREFMISSYGNAYAVIDGGNAEGIKVNGSSNLIIKNLVIKGNGRKNGNITNGLLMSLVNEIEIDSLEIYGFQHSGINILGSRNARITNVYAHDNGFAGIHISGKNANHPVLFDNENLYVGYCKALNNPGDPTVLNNHSGNGILASSVKSGIIEYCEASDNGWDMPWTGNGPVGIWIWDCTDFVIQYCISHNNKTNPSAKDGGGFDLDGGVSNSLIQYCISFDNQGAGFGLYEFGASKPWGKNIVRYNISQNDGILNEGSLAVWRNDSSCIMHDCEIFNNTFYNDTGSGVSFSAISNCERFVFRNNVFAYGRDFLGKGQRLKSEEFLANCFWDLTGRGNFPMDLKRVKNTGAIYENPAFSAPGSLNLTDPAGMNSENLKAYYLLPGSVLINKGLEVQNEFGINVFSKDMPGTKIPQGNAVEIGALEFTEDK